MSEEQITVERFTKRLADFCVSGGPTGLPRRPVDREILCTGAWLGLPRESECTQQEIDDALWSWLTRVAVNLGFDHVTLRRELVDRGFLARATDGSRYRTQQPKWWTSVFDEAVLGVNVAEVVEEARQRRERRRQSHAEGPSG